MNPAQDLHDLSVSIIGTGYVGLVTGATFAHHGIRTVCIDVDGDKIRRIQAGQVPFFEKGLEPLLARVRDAGLLTASTDIERIADTDVTFICVGTPSRPDGAADLSQVEDAARDIGRILSNKTGYHVVGMKSTVPPGTTENVLLPLLAGASGKEPDRDFGLVMIPEFLRQGQAVHDALHPDRIIIGEHDKRAGGVIHWLYEEHRHEAGGTIPILHVEIRAAELIKYAANSLLATKITFANEFARICEKFNIDVYEVMKGVGLDFRINPHFLNAGCGFGGSCFPKDVRAMVSLSRELAVETPLLDAVLGTNDLQPLHLVDLVRDALDGLKDARIAVLGLAFKPDTDDTRETRALPIIRALHAEGAHIVAYDPRATDNFRSMTDIPVEYADSPEAALMGADCAVIHTDWEEIRTIEPGTFRSLLKRPIVVDGRRTWDPEVMTREGIRYLAIGWKNR